MDEQQCTTFLTRELGNVFKGVFAIDESENLHMVSPQLRFLTPNQEVILVNTGWPHTSMWPALQVILTVMAFTLINQALSSSSTHMNGGTQAK